MDRIDLEESSGTQLLPDLRPRMDEPPPVRLISVEDVTRSTLPGLSEKLDHFYCTLWQFQKESPDVYRAENFRLRFQIIPNQKPIERDSIRPQGILIPSLRAAEKKLIEAEIEFLRQRSLTPGHDTLLVKDPAGNWLELFEAIELG